MKRRFSEHRVNKNVKKCKKEINICKYHKCRFHVKSKFSVYCDVHTEGVYYNYNIELKNLCPDVIQKIFQEIIIFNLSYRHGMESLKMLQINKYYFKIISVFMPWCTIASNILSDCSPTWRFIKPIISEEDAKKYIKSWSILKSGVSDYRKSQEIIMNKYINTMQPENK